MGGRWVRLWPVCVCVSGFGVIGVDVIHVIGFGVTGVLGLPGVAVIVVAVLS